MKRLVDLPGLALLQIPQRGSGGFAAGVAADHAAALLPAALAFDLMGGRSVLGHNPVSKVSPRG